MPKSCDGNIEDIIKGLEKLADSVLGLKRESIPRRPIVIEFCGSPKSGKSSCINSLDLFLRRNKFRTKVLTERASVCPVYNKYDPFFNLWTVSSCIAELSEVLANHSKEYDIILIDRGIFDALCWFTWLFTHEHIDRVSFNSITEFLTMSRWRSIIDLVYVFTAKPEISLDREYSNLLTRKTGSIMKPEVLKSYNSSIDEALRNFTDMFKKTVKFDTSEKKLENVNHEVTTHILNILQESTAESVCYFQFHNLNNQLGDIFRYSECITDKTEVFFGARPIVEEDETKVQPLPILVITNKNHNKFFIVKKNKKSTSAKSPEKGKLLLYLGGHVREEDQIHLDKEEFNLKSLLMFALHREIKEETGIDYYSANENIEPYCIWIKTNERSKKHMAICYVMETNFDAIKIRLDNNEFVARGDTKSGKVYNIEEINNNYSELEDWSKIILKEIFDHTPPSEQVLLFDE